MRPRRRLERKVDVIQERMLEMPQDRFRVTVSLDKAMKAKLAYLSVMNELTVSEMTQKLIERALAMEEVPGEVPMVPAQSE